MPSAVLARTSISRKLLVKSAIFCSMACTASCISAACWLSGFDTMVGTAAGIPPIPCCGSTLLLIFSLSAMLICSALHARLILPAMARSLVSTMIIEQPAQVACPRVARVDASGNHPLMHALAGDAGNRSRLVLQDQPAIEQLKDVLARTGILEHHFAFAGHRASG